MLHALPRSLLEAQKHTRDAFDERYMDLQSAEATRTGKPERYNGLFMSRVVYTEFRSTGDQEALRQAHQVRLVAEGEEGTGVNALPGGVYGFTYSPGLPSSPLFAVRRYRSYETHKLASGEIYIIGFATADVARAMSTATAEMTSADPSAAGSRSRCARHDSLFQHPAPSSVCGPESGRVHRHGDTAVTRLILLTHSAIPIVRVAQAVSAASTERDPHN